MAAGSTSSNKAKIARRVIEVLEYFDNDHREATVMDIVRRYDRPQSSTSELLSSLVELGLLYKDPYSRSYRLTPRAALLGSGGQSGAVRDGRLVRLTDRLVAQTGLCVALFGMVGLKAQIISWHGGPRAVSPATRRLYGGLQEPMSDNAAGWLLLSTIAPSRRDGVLRRLNAEAPEGRKFSIADMNARISAAALDGNITGPAGFGSNAEVLAVLLPAEASEHPLAVGFVHGPEDRVNAQALLHSLSDGIAQCLAPMDAGSEVVDILLTAA